MRHFPLLLLLILSGCAQSPDPVTPAMSHNQSNNPVQQLLKQQYSVWAGTPYRLGGASKRGVDCSALVQLTYREHFDVALPRTTEAQAEVGRSIKRSAIGPGDLVFFKTGFSTRHVGMMLDDVRFLHASTSRGVIVSRLDNPYWTKHYWHARRVMSAHP
ncbi:NlpC/P60 family protein [Ferrimonas balearica]|uniref:NlpC/P60 family protein n=1 Tax=Ferrimonas balearica TaxID=44012 RepID=UPI002D7EB538|nr:NlpC/P60 family protein [Ferrimonas balearica]MBY6094856.1 C40 family peptidase [Ferrimonas balearica]